VQSTGSAEIERVTRDTLGWVMREMTGPEGGIYASIDADSEGEEGRYYVWTRSELQDVLGDRYPLAEAAFGITAQGNFEGKSILVAPLPRSIVAARLEITEEEADIGLAVARSQLLAARATRVAPETDHKRIASWNGLMLSAFADAARVLGDAEYLAAAERLATFLQREMVQGDRVARTWMDGTRKQPGFLEDHAAVAAGLLALYQASGSLDALRTARALGAAMVRDFWDADARSFYDTARDHEALITRPRELTDNATPSGAALACDVLLHLATLDGTPGYRDIVTTLLDAVTAPMAEHPLGFGHWLGVADRHLHGAVEVVLAPGTEGDAAMQAVLRRTYVPTLVLARTTDSDAPSLALGREAIDGRTTAYVCRDFTCALPTTDAGELAHQLRQAVRLTE
jgi:hypothetical protein